MTLLDSQGRKHSRIEEILTHESAEMMNLFNMKYFVEVFEIKKCKIVFN